MSRAELPDGQEQKDAVFLEGPTRWLYAGLTVILLATALLDLLGLSPHRVASYVELVWGLTTIVLCSKARPQHDHLIPMSIVPDRR